MAWYWIVLIVLAALAALDLFLVFPHLPRRDMSAFTKFDYAHRGLWGGEVPENSLPAFDRAAAGGYGIELDVHLTRDDVLVVFHDDTLDRVCGVSGRVDDKSLAELKALRLGASSETIPTLDEVLAVVGGRVPMIVEVKSDKRLDELCAHLHQRMLTYDGAWVMESFNPMAVRWFRKHEPARIRGQLSFGLRDQKHTLLNLCCSGLVTQFLTRPDFVARDEKSATGLGMAWMRLLRPWFVAWTVRSPERMAELRKTFDVQIFEGFLPKS